MPTEIEHFLADLRGKGVTLWLEGDGLGLRAPKDVLTAELRRALQERKPAIVACLSAAGVRGIPRTADADTYELSRAQRRLWVIAQLEGGSAAYHVAAAVQLDGALDRDALARAFDALGARHESLRTSFLQTARGPVQRVAQTAPWALRFCDVADAADPAAAAAARARELARAAFDLERDALFRAELVRLAPRRHVLALAMHHIVADGWSLSVLVRELGALYDAFRAGRASPLAPLPIQYRDFAAWRDPAAADDLAYWLERLAPPLPVLALPADRPRPPVRLFRGELLAFAFGADERRGLQRLADAHGATLFMVLCALVNLLLYRYTGQDEIVVGTPVSGRAHPDLDDQIGFFLNTLILRERVEPDEPFSGFLRRMRATALDAYAHQACPFDELVERCAVAPDASRSPLFDVQVSMQNAGSLRLALDGVTVTAQPPVELDNSKFDLAFDFDASDDGVAASVRYDSALFERERIARLAGYLVELARAAVADPQRPCALLSMVPAAERAWSFAQADGPPLELGENTLLDAFAAAVARGPERVAVRCGDETLTYAELDGDANRLARHLAPRGAGETVVAVVLERSPALVSALLGVLAAGFAYVPIDPAYPPERIAAMLRGARARIVVTQASVRERLAHVLARADAAYDVICVDEARDALARYGGERLRPAVGPRSLAYVLSTSGSTGAPKGVEIEHGALANALASMRAHTGISASDVLLAVTTISFDIAGLELYLPLIAGGQVVLASAELARDGALLAARLDAGDVTAMQATPGTWAMLLAAGWRGSASLKAICGGEPLPRALAAALAAKCAVLWNAYGPTETTIWSSVHRIGDEPAGGAVAIGRPLHNTRMLVLDARLQPRPLGATGELYIGGAGVARGYRDRPALTAERFVSDPFAPSPARLYRTGDLARRAFDGTLQFEGRRDDQVKIRGFRVELGDVEAALLRHAGVREAAVARVAGEGGDAALCGYVVPRGETVDTLALRAYLVELLPAYMVPSALVVLPALPVSPNGKLNRAALPPPGAAARPEVRFVAPRTPSETAVAAIWRDVLACAPLGAEDDFFASGGHSLAATRAAFAVREQFGVTVTLTDVFRNPGVAAFAALIDARIAAVPPLAEPAPATARELEMLAIDG